MAQLFSAIPIRANATKILAGWFEDIRQAGLTIEAFLGSYVGETAFTIANNQSSAANVTGLSFSGAAIRSFVIDYQVYRNTTGGGATELAESGQLMGVYSTVAAAWEMTQVGVGDAGVTFSITAAGQVQYTSTNITGTAASSQMKFKYRTMGV